MKLISPENVTFAWWAIWATGDWWQQSHIYRCAQWFVMKDLKQISNFCFTFQNLHQDIEAQNERIKTILELCATVDAQYAKRLKRRRLKPPAKKCSVLQSVGKIIEERWHCIWLRSLEWQCFLEQFTHSSKLKVSQKTIWGKPFISYFLWSLFIPKDELLTPTKECPLTTRSTPCFTHMWPFFISSHFKTVFFFGPWGV